MEGDENEQFLYVHCVRYAPLEPIIEDQYIYSVFRTKETCSCNLCNLIIDGGSIENVISTELVEKLGMKMERKPKTYKLS